MVLIALCVFLVCIFLSMWLGEGTVISVGESPAPVCTTAMPPTGGPPTELSGMAEQTERSPGVGEAPTVKVNAPAQFERDPSRVTSVRTPSLSDVTTDPVTTVPTPVPTATSQSSGVSTTQIASPAATVMILAATPAAVTVDLSVQAQEYRPSVISVPAGARVTVVFDNRDEGIPHSLVIFADPELTIPIYTGKDIIGRNQTTYTFAAPSQPGIYVLGCGVPSPHRTGILIVK